MRISFLFAVIISFLAVGGAFAQEAPSATGYQLGPGDEVMGKVLGEPDFDFTAIVNENGMLQVPFADKPVVAKCRTEAEIRADIVDLLKKQLKHPMLSLLVTQKNRPVATVLGAVRTPSQFELKRKVLLLELLAQSGGPTEDAGGVIQVLRTQPPTCSDGNDAGTWPADPDNPSQPPTKLFNLSAVNAGLADSNPVIYPGDVVVVLKALPIYITGEVLAPQGIYLKEGGTTLTEAIAKIGGVRAEAKTKDIKIYRLKKNASDTKDRDIITANYDLILKGLEQDVALQPNDIVVVDRAKESIAKAILNVVVGAGKSIISAGSSSIGYRVLY